jgi:MFS family permease
VQRDEQESNEMHTSDTSRSVLRLAGYEIRRTWIAYLATGLGMFVLGGLVAPTLEVIGQVDDRARKDVFQADFLMLILATLLATNFMARDYFASWKDPFTRRLTFLRSLPIPVRVLVSGRMVAMCFTLLFTVPAFFLPIYFFGDHDLSGAAFVSFALIWIGYALMWSGINLYLELTTHGLIYSIICFVLVGVILGASAAMIWVFDYQVSVRVADLARDHGLFAAAVALVSGVLVFGLLALATERRVQRRELPA